MDRSAKRNTVTVVDANSPTGVGGAVRETTVTVSEAKPQRRKSRGEMLSVRPKGFRRFQGESSVRGHLIYSCCFSPSSS